MKTSNRIRKHRSAAPSARQVETQRPSRGSGRRLEVNIQLPQSKLDDLKHLARVSKLGWPAYVAGALCCYAGAVQDRMHDEEQEAAEARKKEVAARNKTIPVAESKPGFEVTGEWVRLALAGVELKALEQWATKFSAGASIHNVARYAMLFALTNPKKFQDWLGNMARYCEAEDIDQITYLRSLLAARYSTKKLKIA